MSEEGRKEEGLEKEGQGRRGGSGRRKRVSEGGWRKVWRRRENEEQEGLKKGERFKEEGVELKKKGR